ncbi:threonine-phosphate decarboxylase CobD [Candidatus Methylospira mobilis]|uniref:threonine-phosphate decarboxylase CobD n=1 Tax=Candidatus Methylospira mobilis TaxID=1808979 RepID=UPI0028E93414|nr:threonine-phosphate decarboxylase CobD [Candidatus Methylospira mobilis]WNV03356.1 threonine-phosphate decarboxylase CobD [Candidatus Methylospira mobilis]
MLEHGGRLARAAAASGTPIEDWLDLSTGVSPYAWPIPEIPARCWTRLPEEDDGLIEAASVYYGAHDLLAVDGSQCVIQLLPKLREPGRVGVLSPTYAEHAHAWRQWGHEVAELDADGAEEQLDSLNVLVAVNPNNPTGDCRTRDDLLRWHEALWARGGWLVVDEAFMDATPQLSVIAETHRSGLIVLRSFGKFFGCPGARLGFVAAERDVLQRLRELAGPWPVSGAARWIGRLALADFAWHETACALLASKSQALSALLQNHGLPPLHGTALFQWTKTEQAERLYTHFAEQRILLRLYTQPRSLRFGLPGTPDEWRRLEEALKYVLP